LLPTFSNDTDGRSMPRRPLARLLIAVLCVAWAGLPVRVSASDPAGLAAAIERGLVTVVQEGVISWYGAAFQDRPTASGERFDSDAMTMAHPTLPFGTHVKVTNLRNGRSVVVRVNDRGPFVGSRIADLSEAAATSLGMMRRGLARARIEIVDGGTPVASLD
jgi:rare lipoprotein A